MPKGDIKICFLPNFQTKILAAMVFTEKDSKGEIFFKARYRDNDSILYCEWIGFINDIEPAKKACMRMVELLEEKKCKMLLNDNREQIGPWPPISDFLNDIWKPALAKAGLLAFAHIHSENVFTQFTANRVLNAEKSHGIHFEHFDNEERAIFWLKSIAEED